MTQIIINDILPYTQAVAIASQTIFSTNWTANDATDVWVYYTPFGSAPDDATQLLATNLYTVQFIGTSDIVQVTLVNPANAGDIITITRMTPAAFLNLYTNTNFTPSMLNNDFGILTLVDQQAQVVNQLVAPRYNYSALINQSPEADTILPILQPNQVWMKNSAGTAIVGADIPDGGLAPASATYITVNNETTNLPNSFRLIAGNNVSLVAGTNQITINVSGQTINPGSINDLAYYSANGSVISALATADNGVLVTSGSGVPSISSTLPSGLVIPSPLINEILDSNGNVVLNLVATPSAVNYVAAINQSTGFNPGFDAAGSDTNIGMGFNAKGTGQIQFSSANTTIPWEIFSGTALQHTTQFAFPNTAATRTVTFQDSSGTLAYLSNIPSVSPAALTSANDTNVTITLGGTPSTALLEATSITLGWTGTLAVSRGGTGESSVTIAPTASAWAGWDTNKNLSANSFIDAFATTVTSGTPVVLTVVSKKLQFFTGSTAQTVTLPVASTLVEGQQFYIVNQSSATLTVQSSGSNTVIAMAANTVALITCILNSGTSATSWFAEYEQSAITLPLSLSNGGTNASLTAANGAIPYSTASAIALLSPAGSAGLALLSGGAGAPTWSINPPITQVKNTSITTTGAFSYTPTTGVQYAVFELQGGGGGSGGTTGVTSQSAASGAGAGGNYLKLWVSGSANLNAITGSVGVGGTAGLAGNNSGGDGGNTTLTINSGTQWIAHGGLGGAGQTASSSPQSSGVSGGISASTIGTNGTLIVAIAGSGGGIGYSNGNNITYGWLNAIGGGAFMANSGRPIINTTGVSGGVYGGGASGAINSTSSNATGALGGQGIVIITEFISI